MKVALAQIAPAFLDRAHSLERVITAIRSATSENARLVAFGESLVPGYPIWISRTGGARFDDPDQKRFHARYLEEGVSIERGDLEPVQQAARDGRIAVVLGIAERAQDRGGHSLFCSRVFIDEHGDCLSVHRKLMPTYEERLAWAAGDGAGLVTHTVGPFQVGALNCWENWMPLARAALHAAGEDLHIMLWPGSTQLTREITRFAAREARSFVVSAGSLLRESDLPADLLLREELAQPGELLYDGGSCVAGPDGEWVLEPIGGQEGVFCVELDPARVLEERQNFDPSGHYARPELLSLTVDRRRISAARWIDE